MEEGCVIVAAGTTSCNGSTGQSCSDSAYLIVSKPGRGQALIEHLLRVGPTTQSRSNEAPKHIILRLEEAVKIQFVTNLWT